MGYELMGRTHAALVAGRDRAAGQAGQGTVEYVGLILLIAVALAGVVKASGSLGDQGIAKSIMQRLNEAIGTVAAAK